MKYKKNSIFPTLKTIITVFELLADYLKYLFTPNTLTHSIALNTKKFQ